MSFGFLPTFHLRHPEELFDLLQGPAGESLLQSGACVVQGLNLSTSVKTHTNVDPFTLAGVHKACNGHLNITDPGGFSTFLSFTLAARDLLVKELYHSSHQLAKRFCLDLLFSTHRIETEFWEEMEKLDPSVQSSVLHSIFIPENSFPREEQDDFLLPILLKEQKTAARDLSFPFVSTHSFSSELDSHFYFTSFFSYTPWKQTSFSTASFIHSGSSMSCYICPEHASTSLKQALYQQMFHPDLLVQQGCSVNKAVVEVGDVLLLAPGSFTFNFSHGFQIIESSGFCFKPWLASLLHLPLPRTFPLEFTIHQLFLQSQERLRSPDQDHWIDLTVLKTQQELRDQVLRKLRALGGAILSVHYRPDFLFTSQDFYGHNCVRCQAWMYLVSVNLASWQLPHMPLRKMRSKPVSKKTLPDPKQGFCLDCALQERPPRCGLVISIPESLGFSVSRPSTGSNVVIKIQNGVSSALKQTQLLAGTEQVDLRLRCPHQLASLPSPVKMKTSLRACQWSEEEKTLFKEFSKMKKLVSVEIPPSLTTDLAFEVKLRQLQIFRSFHLVLKSPLESVPYQNLKLEFEDSVIEELKKQIMQSTHRMNPEEQEASDVSSEICEYCFSFFSNEKKSCMDLIQKLEMEPHGEPVRQVHVPRTGLQQSLDPVVVVSFPSSVSSPKPTAAKKRPRKMVEEEKMEMEMIDRRMMLGSLRRLLKPKRKSKTAVKQESKKEVYLLACDVLKALMTEEDYAARCQNISSAMQKIFNSIRSLSHTVSSPMVLPNRPQIALYEGVKQPVLNQKEIHSLYVTLYHYDQLIAQKLKSFVAGIWNLAI